MPSSRCRYWPAPGAQAQRFGGPTGRRQPKDAYDILLAVSDFVDGPEAPVNAFRAGQRANNTAYEFTPRTRAKDFTVLDQDGPIRAAEFYSGPPVTESVSDKQS